MDALAAVARVLGNQKEFCRNIEEAVIQDDPDEIASFIARGADFNAPNQDGWTPVQLACWHGKFKALQQLLKSGPNLDAQDRAGRTAIHLAAFTGNERCLRRILHAGANPNIPDKNGLTALHKAAVAGRLESIRVLQEYKADASITTPEGLTPVHLAAWKGQREALRQLCAYDNRLVNLQSQDGSSALHEAVRSGDESCVQLLLQLGADTSLIDGFGRSACDIAFAAGDRKLHSLLAMQPSKPSIERPPEDLPQATELWQYLHQQAPAPAQSSLTQKTKTPVGAPQGAGAKTEVHPRKQFETWLSGILFPQQRQESAVSAAGSSPYPNMNAAQGPPPSLAKPSYQKIMQAPGQHSVGRFGGSNFAARRKEDAARVSAQQVETAPAPAPVTTMNDAPASSIQLTLDPYDDSSAPSAPSAPPAVASKTTGSDHAANVKPFTPENPLAAMMQALGKKAQQDFSAAMQVASEAAESLKQKKGAQGAIQTGRATFGDEEYDDDDEYDVSVLNKVQVGKSDDREDWGEFEDEHDEWGTTAEEVLAAKKRAQRLAASEGRIYTLQEAQEKLEELDLATSKAQGWLRGLDARQKLTTMGTLASAYSKQDSGSTPQIRQNAGSPFEVIMKGLWTQKPPQQEEERLAVQSHLQHSTVAASIAAQPLAKKPLTVPEIDFFDVWKATDGFGESNFILEDSFGKVYRASMLGGTHAVRVLNHSRFDQEGWDNFISSISMIRHPHIVGVNGVTPSRGLLIHALPESGNLLYILQTGVLPTSEALRWTSCVGIAIALASAADYLQNLPKPVAHGQLNAASVYFDRNAIARIGGVGLQQLCGTGARDMSTLQLQDVHSLGELLMQLLTLNTTPIDEKMRKDIVSYIDSGKHICPSSSLQWPAEHARAFEAVALVCMKSDASTDIAELLSEQVTPALLQLRDKVVAELTAKAGSAVRRADGSVITPFIFRCPLTGEVMLDPVRAADGFVYERSAVEQWLQLGCKCSPMTNVPLSHPYLIADRSLRQSIESWLQEKSKHAADHVIVHPPNFLGQDAGVQW